MIRNPSTMARPGDETEEELLKLQNEFLTARRAPSAQLIRRSSASESASGPERDDCGHPLAPASAPSQETTAAGIGPSASVPESRPVASLRARPDTAPPGQVPFPPLPKVVSWAAAPSESDVVPAGTSPVGDRLSAGAGSSIGGGGVPAGATPAGGEGGGKAYEPLKVLGAVREKGFSGLTLGPEARSWKVRPPEPTVQAFPVARHRSEAPAWGGRQESGTTGANGIGRRDEDEAPAHAASLAQPPPRRRKEGLRLSKFARERGMAAGAGGGSGTGSVEARHVRRNGAGGRTGELTVGERDKEQVEARQPGTVGKKERQRWVGSVVGNGNGAEESGAVLEEESLHGGGGGGAGIVPAGVEAERVAMADMNSTLEGRRDDPAAMESMEDRVGYAAEARARSGMSASTSGRLPGGSRTGGGRGPGGRSRAAVGALEGEAEKIDAENRERIAGMSVAEVAAAQRELAELLPAGALEAIRKRGVAKLRGTTAESKVDKSVPQNGHQAGAVLESVDQRIRSGQVAQTDKNGTPQQEMERTGVKSMHLGIPVEERSRLGLRDEKERSESERLGLEPGGEPSEAMDSEAEGAMVAGVVAGTRPEHSGKLPLGGKAQADGATYKGDWTKAREATRVDRALESKTDTAPAVSFVSSEDWTNRVESVRGVRFGLDGCVVPPEIASEAEAIIGIATAGATGGPARMATGAVGEAARGLNVRHVAERDLLRSEGDPGRAGYSLKEAIALARSTVPGQRTAALQLITGVLTRAAKALQSEPSDVGKSDGPDWPAIWAYALGPEPMLGAAVRIALDDPHATVLLAAARALQAVLTCQANEAYFDSCEAYWRGEAASATCPIFRRKPSAGDGFLGGGRWKDNVKPAEFLPPGSRSRQRREGGGGTEEEDEGEERGEEEEEEEEGEEGEREGGTVGSDVDAASRDVAAGMLRMGILPRIRYLLEVVRLEAADEPLLESLVAFSRHSPAGALAVMQCPRLMDVVVDRFLASAAGGARQPTGRQLAAIKLLKVLSQADRSYATAFIQSAAFQLTLSYLLLHRTFSLTPSTHSVPPNHSTRAGFDWACVESLRLWRVCARYRIGVGHFSDYYPSLWFWLAPPPVDDIIDGKLFSQAEATPPETGSGMILGSESAERKLPGKGVSEEVWALARESFLLLEAVSESLPKLRLNPRSGASDGPEAYLGEVETMTGSDLDALADEPGLTWSVAVPLVHTALQWLAPDFIGAILQNGSRDAPGGAWRAEEFGGVGALAAVLHFLASVVEASIPQPAGQSAGATWQDRTASTQTQGVWLPPFVRQVGKALLLSGLLTFSVLRNASQVGVAGDGETDSALGPALEKLVQLGRKEGEAALAALSCLRGATRLVKALDGALLLAGLDVGSLGVLEETDNLQEDSRRRRLGQEQANEEQPIKGLADGGEDGWGLAGGSGVEGGGSLREQASSPCDSWQGERGGNRARIPGTQTEKGFLPPLVGELTAVSMRIGQELLDSRVGLERFEFKARGGPAPGVGVGWGSAGGGLWSCQVAALRAKGAWTLEMLELIGRSWAAGPRHTEGPWPDKEAAGKSLEAAKKLPELTAGVADPILRLDWRLEATLRALALMGPADREALRKSLSSCLLQENLLGEVLSDAAAARATLRWVRRDGGSGGGSLDMESHGGGRGGLGRGGEGGEGGALGVEPPSLKEMRKVLLRHFEEVWLAVKDEKRRDRAGGQREGSLGGGHGGVRKRRRGGGLETVMEDEEIEPEVELSESYPKAVPRKTQLLTEWVGQRLPLPSHWLLSPLAAPSGGRGSRATGKGSGRGHLADVDWMSRSPEDTEATVKCGLWLLLALEMAPNSSRQVSADAGTSGPMTGYMEQIPLVRKVHALSEVFMAEGSLFSEEGVKEPLAALQQIYGRQLDSQTSQSESATSALSFLEVISPAYATYAQGLVDQFAAASYGDESFGRQVALLLRRQVAEEVRQSTWHALVDAQALALLPPLERCCGTPDGYLHPPEGSEKILNQYLSSWTSGSLDKAAARNAMPFTLAMAHLASYLFSDPEQLTGISGQQENVAEERLQRQAAARTLLRSVTRGESQKAHLVQLIKWQLPSASQHSVSAQIGGSGNGQLRERLNRLKAACAGEAMLLSLVDELERLCTAGEE